MATLAPNGEEKMKAEGRNSAHKLGNASQEICVSRAAFKHWRLPLACEHSKARGGQRKHNGAQNERNECVICGEYTMAVESVSANSFVHSRIAIITEATRRKA